MSKQFKPIPQELRNKVILITGTYPGVGKSFVKNNWAIKLRRGGYNVFNDGTTQKAASEHTIHSRLRISKKQTINDTPIHPLTDGFFFIDEAWMWSQEDIDTLISKYPRMCFVLFGDPLQLSVTDLSKSTVLSKFNFGWNLTVNHRATDEELYNTIVGLKQGKLSLDFIAKHVVDVNKLPLDTALQICLRNETRDRGNFTSAIKAGNIYRSSTSEYDKETGFVYSRTNKQIWWKNGELYRISRIDEIGQIYLQRLDGTIIPSPIDKETLNKYFEYSPYINVHKAQGDTIDASIPIIIDIDDFTYPDLIRQLYVAISRAKSSSQIYFPKDSALRFIDQIIQNNVMFSPLVSPLDTTYLFDSDSTDLTNLSHAEDIISLFQYIMEKFPATSRHIYVTKSGLISSPAGGASANPKYISNNSNGSISATLSQDNTARSGRVLDTLEGAALKNAHKSIQKYLGVHKGIGYSSRWDESQREYADSIRMNYTLTGMMQAKSEKIEEAQDEQKQRGLAIAAGLKPKKTEAEIKAYNNLKSKKKYFYKKHYAEGKTREEIDELWNAVIRNN